jgi:hypothetical protein
LFFDCRDVVLKRIEAYTVKNHNKGRRKQYQPDVPAEYFNRLLGA